MEKNLDFAILNLIQHVELNRIGWWDYVIQRLILATFWMEGKPISKSIEVLDELINKYFNLYLGEKLETAISTLLRNGDLIEIADGSLKLSESTKKALVRDIDDAEKITEVSKQVYLNNLSKSIKSELDSDLLWDDFNNKFLRPFIKNMGANIYNFLNGDNTKFDQSLLEKYTKGYAADKQEAIRNAALEFLKSLDPNIRSFILRMLNACFCIEAGGLEKATLEALQESLIQPKEICLFIDTNFLFSILELHENPSNSAAIGLIQLIKNLEKTLNIKLYVSNQTLSEARNVLLGIIDSLNDAQLTPNIAGAASKLVSGLSRKYFDDIKRSKVSMTPREYFQPYIDNLILVLKRKGVEIYNEDNSYLNTRQDVIDDILEQSKYEEKKWGERAKTYKTLEHDIVLWHFIKEKRTTAIDSPLDAKYWIVTIDYRYLGFDEYKKSLGFMSVPVCIHPSTLIQLLQFWIPRSNLLENTLYSSLWLPFIFRDLDPQSETITIEIIKTMSRFSNIGDLPEETIMEILVSDALRQKIKNEPIIAKHIDLIREALIEQNQKIQSEAKTAIERNKEFEKLMKEKDSEIDTLKSNIQEITRISEVKLEEIKNKLSERDEEDNRNKIFRKYTFRGVVCPLLSISILLFIFKKFFIESFVIFYIIAGILLLTATILMNFFGSRNSIINKTKVYIQFHKYFIAIISVIFTLMLGIIANALYDQIKTWDIYSIFSRK